MACDGNCSGTCTGGCGSGCDSGCYGSCKTGCTDACTSCVGTCVTGCTGTCTTGCSSCSGNCIGTCTSCSGTCSGSCSGCSGCSSCSGSCSGCSGSCSGCSGCTSCSGTCSGDCNNACQSTSAAQTIADLGSNIAINNPVRVNDFKQLRDAIHNELSRRNKTIPSDGYTVEPAVNSKILIEHAQKVFDDIKVMDSTKFKTINNTTIVKTDTYNDAITYIQTLMNQNIK